MALTSLSDGSLGLSTSHPADETKETAYAYRLMSKDQIPAFFQLFSNGLGETLRSSGIYIHPSKEFSNCSDKVCFLLEGSLETQAKLYILMDSNGLEALLEHVQSRE
ncbi:hypothetical protein AVEN_260991-1 [Araneus ventricosus]|uniref:Uncharacterized protein n=1 Tax=Araneus ventricosus TaxID=182803 RepID=A0A4Y2KZW2_ARAVE|nr:hypothetical protein AVEN_260991-1 [Araneus ventricosus]